MSTSAMEVVSSSSKFERAVQTLEAILRRASKSPPKIIEESQSSRAATTKSDPTSSQFLLKSTTTKRKREEEDNAESKASSSQLPRKKAKAAPVESPVLAVACQGVRRHRRWEVTLLSIAIPDKVFIFDLIQLGTRSMDDRLRRIKDKTLVKLMFDCRLDSNALFRQHNVLLDGVLDLELLEIILRRTLVDFVPLRNIIGYMKERRSTTRSLVDNLMGLSKCFRMYSVDYSFMIQRQKGENEVQSQKDFWHRRPVTYEMMQYCHANTVGLFHLFDVFEKNPRFTTRFESAFQASRIYAEFFRDLPNRTNDVFEENGFLPLKLDLFIEFGSTGPWTESVFECDGCRREYDFFFERRGMCLVCNLIRNEKL